MLIKLSQYNKNHPLNHLISNKPSQYLVLISNKNKSYPMFRHHNHLILNLINNKSYNNQPQNKLSKIMLVHLKSLNHLDRPTAKTMLLPKFDLKFLKK